MPLEQLMSQVLEQTSTCSKHFQTQGLMGLGPFSEKALLRTSILLPTTDSPSQPSKLDPVLCQHLAPTKQQQIRPRSLS